MLVLHCIEASIISTLAGASFSKKAIVRVLSLLRPLGVSPTQHGGGFHVYVGSPTGRRSLTDTARGLPVYGGRSRTWEILDSNDLFYLFIQPICILHSYANVKCKKKLSTDLQSGFRQ